MTKADQVGALLQTGLSDKEIAEKVKCHPSYVRVVRANNRWSDRKRRKQCFPVSFLRYPEVKTTYHKNVTAVTRDQILYHWTTDDMSADQIAKKLFLQIGWVIAVILNYESGNVAVGRRSGGLNNAKSNERDSAQV